MVVILLFWSTAYLVNFSSRLLTIISNSLILSSFSVMALGDLTRTHMQLFWERFKTFSPTLLLRQRSKVWTWWANVIEPDDQFYLFAILFHKGKCFAYNLCEYFLYKPSAGLLDQHFAPQGRTRQRGPAKCLPHVQIASFFGAKITNYVPANHSRRSICCPHTACHTEMVGIL